MFVCACVCIRKKEIRNPISSYLVMAHWLALMHVGGRQLGSAQRFGEDKSREILRGAVN